MRKLFNHFLLIPLILAGVGFFLVPNAAHAQGVVDGAINLLIGGTDVFYGLIGKIFWWVLIPIASKILALVGTLMDYALYVATLPTLYNSEVIGLAWTIIRDIANMIFIFVLVFEGIRTILSIGNASKIKKTITSVVIAALLLNFSLFFTKVFIDVSNVGASWFIQGVKSIGGQESVSSSIRASLQMERMTATYGDAHLNTQSFSLQSFIQGILLFVLTCVAIYVLFKVADLIMGRIVAFIILLITSPIGFTGIFLDLGDISEYAKKWWKEMTGQMFMLPMFFLMLYITMYLVDRFDKLFPTTTSAQGGFEPVNYFMFVIIIMLLLRSLKIAEEYSGEIGGMAAKFLQQGMGVVAGGAFMGTIGKAAIVLQTHKNFQAWAARSEIVGKTAMRGVAGVAGASFGVKSSFDGITKATGIAGVLPKSKDVFKGADKGFSGKIAQEVKDEKEFVKMLGIRDDGAKNRKTYADNLQSGLYARVFKTGAGGAVTGAAIGSVAGPLGAAVGAVAGGYLTKKLTNNQRFDKDIAQNVASGYNEMKKDISNVGPRTAAVVEILDTMPESQGINMAKIDLQKEAGKEVAKETGKSVDGIFDKVNKEIGDGRSGEDLETDLKKTLGEIEKNTRTSAELSDGIKAEISGLRAEEEKLKKHLSGFDSLNYTMGGIPLGNKEAFEKMKKEPEAQLRSVQDKIKAKETPVKSKDTKQLENKVTELKDKIRKRQDAFEREIATLEADGTPFEKQIINALGDPETIKIPKTEPGLRQFQKARDQVNKEDSDKSLRDIASSLEKVASKPEPAPAPKKDDDKDK